MLVARSIAVLIHGLFLMALSITLLVLAVIALFSGAFTTFVLILALDCILGYTALRGATEDMNKLSAQLRARHEERTEG